MFYDNLLRQCKLAGVSPSAVLDEIEMSRGNLNSWKKGGEPGLVTAQKIAQVLSIPVTLLLDEDDAKNSPDFLYIESRSAQFPDRLQRIMDEKGLTAYKLAHALHVSKQTVGNWRTGIVPQGENLEALSTYLGVSVDYLLRGDETEGLRKAPAISEDDGRRATFTKAFDRLNPEQQDIVLAMMREMSRKK